MPDQEGIKQQEEAKVFIATKIEKTSPFYKEARSIKIEKESAQREPSYGEYVPRPFSNYYGDLIDFWASLYGMNPFHSTCLRTKATCAVGLGLDFLDEGKNQKEFEDQLSKVNLLGESFLQVINEVALDYGRTGNGYLEVVVDKTGIPKEFYLIPAINTFAYQLVRGSKKPRAWRVNNETGSYDDFEMFIPGESKNGSFCIHFAEPSPLSRYYGAPSWEGCVEDIELSACAKQYNKKFFINSGVPDCAVIIENGDLTKKDKEQIQLFFQQNYKGIANAHKAIFIPVQGDGVAVRIEPIGVSMKDRDMSFKNLGESSRDAILSAHGVPPRLAGVVTSGQLGGGGEVAGQFKVFKELVVDPMQRTFENSLKPVFRLMGFGEVQFSDMDVSIQETPSTFYPAMVGSNIYKINEARKELGLPELSEEELNAMQGNKTAQQGQDQGQPQGEQTEDNNDSGQGPTTQDVEKSLRVLKSAIVRK